MDYNPMDDFIKNIGYYINLFDSKKYNLELYFSVINSKELTRNKIRDILCWKLSGNLRLDQLSQKKQEMINRAVNCLRTINQYKHRNINELDFNKCLHFISPHGSVIPLFIKHICRPEEYPLFDQHVYRTYSYFMTLEVYIGTITKSIVDKDYQKYSEFFNKLTKEFSSKYSPKQIDGALMFYGKELKRISKLKER